MALTAVILEDTAKTAGKQVRYRFDGTGGPFFRSKFLDTAVNSQLFGDSVATTVEGQGKDAELELALEETLAGRDPHLLTYDLNTLDEMRTYVTRSIANITGGYSGPLESQIEEILNSKVFLDQFDNSQLNGYLEGSNVGQVNGWVNWIDGLHNQITTYVQGIPEQTP